LYFPKGDYDDTEILTLPIKFKVIVMHANVKFSENLVTNALVQDFCNDWQRMPHALNHFFQLMQFANPADTAIFLRNEKNGPPHLLYCLGTKTMCLAK
jgi:hypothetical protein